MKRAYKFLLRPTAKQVAALEACLEDTRQLYNAAYPALDDPKRRRFRLTGCMTTCRVVLQPSERERDMAIVKINTSDTAWVERMHAVTAAEIVTYGTDIKGAVYFQVEVEVETVEHVEFAGAKMIRFYLGGNAPNDANPNAMYPETYLVRA